MYGFRVSPAHSLIPVGSLGCVRLEQPQGEARTRAAVGEIVLTGVDALLAGGERDCSSSGPPEGSLSEVQPKEGSTEELLFGLVLVYVRRLVLSCLV